MINIKSTSEIAKMRAAGKIVSGTFKELEKHIKPGITTKELDKIAFDYIKSQGAEPSFLGYCGYPASICASVNDTVIHGIPDGTVLKEGEGTPAMDIPMRIIGSTIRPEILERYIDKKKPMVALTYDDGPYAKTESKIVDTLAENGCVATFFYLGNRVENDTDTVKMAYDAGCEIGNHSWSHPDLTGLSNKEIKSQLNRTNKIISKVIGVKPELFRPPYGSFNDRVLEAADMPAILWTVDTLDWSSRDAKAVFKVIKKTKNLDGKIILMHSIYGSTAKATEKIVPYLQKKGYQRERDAV